MLSRTRSHTRFNDDVLVVGIDIAKVTHVAVAEGPEGRTSRPFSFANSREGFESLQLWLTSTAGRFGTRSVVIGLEPTGHYWKALGEWLQDQGLVVRFVSPLSTKRAKEMLDGSPLKSDAKDARVIADLVRQGKSRPLGVQPEVFQHLRYLSEQRARLVQERTALINRLHRVLDLLFPELPALFSCLDQQSVYALLKVASTPQAVVELGIEPLTQLLWKASHSRLGHERATAILKAASSSIGCKQGTQALQLELEFLLVRIDLATRQRRQIEMQMAEALRQVEYAELLLGIPGLGVVTVAILLGELGDLRRFDNGRQVLKMAGLNLFEISSGVHRGQIRITKRGRPHLRRILYLTALRLVQKDGLLYDYRARYEATKPSPKIAIACSRRLLKAIFLIAKTGQPFDRQRFGKPLTEASLQSLAA